MPADDPNEVVTNPQPLSREKAFEVEEYWTPDRMSNARPVPLPNVFIPRRVRELLDKSSAIPGTSEAGPVTTEPVPPDAEGMSLRAAGFNTRLVSNMSVYPYAIVGKWFMRFGGTDYVGTGWVIGERTVFSAGHCVNKRLDGWATNVFFRAQFRDGSSVGSWALPSLASLRGWTQDTDFEFDMAMGMSTTAIRPTTGKAGYIANVGQIQGIIKSVGYPAESISGFNFNGQKMWECDGDYIKTESGIMSMNNNMTEGCSGGPGFFEKAGKPYAIWVNSFRDVSEPNILCSPYFGKGFTNLIQWMKDNGGD